MSKMSETSISKEFFGLEIYRERGSIIMARLDKAADSNCSADEAFKSVPPIEGLKRAAAVVVYHQREGTPPSEKAKAIKLMEFMEKIVKEAIAFGDPTDPNVLEHIIKHDSKSRIVVPSGPTIPYKIQCKDTPQDTLLGGYQLTPDFGKIAGLS
jgi:hypothetical protein